MRTRLLAIAHPMLFGIYPVLRLCLAPSDPAQRNDFLMIVAVMVAVTAIILWLLRFVLPELAKRAVLLSAFYLVFLNYLGFAVFIVGKFPGATFLSNMLKHPVFALVPILILVGLILFGLRRSRSDFSTTTLALTIFATVAVCSVIVPFVAPYITGSRDRWAAAAETIVNKTAVQEIQPASASPDIYYVIVDGYARADVLQRLYGFDNTAFLEHLREQGFVVPRQSQSNYPQTHLSLASSLNMSYLDTLTDAVGPASSDRRPLRYLIEENSVARLLRRAGYRFILVRSQFSATKENPQADESVCNSFGLNPILNNIIVMTPLVFWRPVQQLEHDDYRGHILCELDKLADLPNMPGPKFVFAHIILPHPPFVFGPNGEERAPAGPILLNDGSSYPFSAEQYRSGYRDQLTFLNAALVKTLDTIVAGSARRPVIILQADHGPGSMLDWESAERSNLTERLAIFSAFLVPDDQRGLFYDSMTPVNTFRVLLNAYFGTDFQLLDDRSYYAAWQYPYAFVQVWPDVSKDLTRGE